jgi:cytochrome c biogenesis protein CcmG, thiol:disulfide interchange protein DsbE
VLAGCGARSPACGAGDRFPPQSFAQLDRAGALALPGGDARPLVVNIWATWCEPCRREMPSLERLHALAPGGVRVVGISVDDDRLLAAEFARARGLTFANGIDPGGVLAAADLAVTRFPTTFVIDARGVIRWREEAARDWTDPASLEKLRAVLGAAP